MPARNGPFSGDLITYIREHGEGKRRDVVKEVRTIDCERVKVKTIKNIIQESNKKPSKTKISSIKREEMKTI